MDFVKIKEIVAARDQFLAEHPEYNALQAEITTALSTAGNQHNRLVVLQAMMLDRLNQIADVWSK